MQKILFFFVLPALMFGQSRNRETFDTVGGKLYRVRTVTIRQEMPDTLALFNEVQEAQTLFDTARAQLIRKKEALREGKRLLAQIEKDRKKPKGNKAAEVAPIVAPQVEPKPEPKPKKKAKKTKGI